MAKFDRLFGALVLSVVILGSLPQLLAILFYHSFLLSPDWVARTGSVGVIFGIATMLSGMWCVLRTWDAFSDVPFRKIAGVIVAMGFGYFGGKNFVILSGPMIYALIAGEPVERTFTVTHADRGGSRGCYSPVDVQDLPLLINKICGVPDELRQQLTPGTHIIVTGLGTETGLYAESVRLAE